MSDELKLLTTVANQAEAEMVSETLSEAGIRSLAQMGTGIRLGPAAEQEILVQAADYERALEVLNAEIPSEEELEALSQAPIRPEQEDGDDTP